MASFWSDELITFLRGTTGQTENGILSVATETVVSRAIELGLGYNLSLYEMIFATGSVDNFTVETPSTGLITLFFSKISCIDTANNKTGNLRVELFEGTTTSADGDDTNYYLENYNRNTTLTPDFIVKHTPTITDDGTELFHTIASSSYEGSAGLTYQLKTDTKYLIRITNNSDVTEEFSCNVVLFQLPE